jgi:hypothetical protein
MSLTITLSDEAAAVLAAMLTAEAPEHVMAYPRVWDEIDAAFPEELGAGVETVEVVE